jgi:DNA-binding HxlR family transcriptional regulator
MEKFKSCSMEFLLNKLSGTWTTYILWFLHKEDSLHFGELRRKIGNISTKVLTERLRMLESVGIIYRHSEPTISPKVSYGLTERGKQLNQAITPLYQLSLQWYEFGQEIQDRPHSG